MAMSFNARSQLYSMTVRLLIEILGILRIDEGSTVGE